MLKLTLAAVVALVIGLTARDLTITSGEGPEAAWEARAAEVDTYLGDNAATGDAHEKLTEAGERIKDWLLEHADRKTQ